jgi:DNA mismatch repair protein MutS2
VLGPIELRDVARVAGAGRALRRFIHANRERAPRLAMTLATDPTLDALAEEIQQCFDRDGTLADHASPRLRELRGEYQASRQRILNRMNEIMSRYDSILQDRFVTEREGRYVVPVRSDAHERFPGIVHTTSASGATLFVEPRAVIPLGNRLKMLESDVTREEFAIYARLSSLVSDSLPSVVACADALALADVRAAVAKLAVDLQLRFPDVIDEPRLELVRARHPLLVLDLPEVVPSDLTVFPSRALVVSGPNAGGKTVALKTLGLAALMLRAGLPIACGDGSRAGIFELVLTDVGDDQSLQKNLSTFSAHVTNIVTIINQAMPGALVLFDELAGGTDPREGEALAAGILDSLCARGATIAITTHYEGLKVLATADERFRNASVGFNLASLEPTFAVVMDLPGSSSALAVARSYGMPSTVLERADKFLDRSEQDFETVVRKLHDERAALELARAAAETKGRELNATRLRLEEERDAIRQKQANAFNRATEELLERVKRAREELRAATTRVRQKKLGESDLREAQRAIDRIASEVAIGGDLEPQRSHTRETTVAIDVTHLRKGKRVYVPRLRAEAEIIEVLGHEVRVAAGSLKLTVSIAELRDSQAASKPQAPASSRNMETKLEVPIQTRENTCDLRGLRADDAVAMAISFLDRSITDNRKVAYLLHGHGTGALKEVLRKELSGSPYVAASRPGERHEGGDGVTVVWLR